MHSLPLAVSTVASALDFGIIIADAGYNLTGHFSFLADSNAVNGFERLLVAGVKRGGQGVPTGTIFV